MVANFRVKLSPKMTITQVVYSSGFLFATAKVASITVMIFFHIILHPAVLIYDFHIFITSRQSLSTTVPFWTTLTRMIILHLLNNVKEKNNVIS